MPPPIVFRSIARDFKRRELLTGSQGDNHAESNRSRAIVKKTLRLDEHQQTTLGLRFLESCDD